jgi:hypothetical protein
MPVRFAVLRRYPALFADLQVLDDDGVIVDTTSLRLDDPAARSAYAQQLQSRLNGHGRSLPDLEQGLARVAAQAGGEGTTVNLARIVPERINWLWHRRIPLGMLALLDGDPGIGKSLITTDLAARVSTGRPMPDGSPGVRGGVVLLSAEDSLRHTIRPRLDAAGADCRRIIALTEVQDADGPRPLTLPDDVPVIERAIAQVDATVVFMDPLPAYLGERTNSWRDQDVRRALAPLAAMGERTGAAVVPVRHLNKATSVSPLYRGGGSIGIIGAARSGLMVGYVPSAASDGVRFLATSKSNLAPPAPALSWTIEARDGVPLVAWGGEIPDFDLAAALGAPSRRDPDAPSQLEEAQQFLRDVLAEGPVTVNDLKREAKGADIKWATVRRAKDALGVGAEKVGFRDGSSWSWRLPEYQGRLDAAEG